MYLYKKYFGLILITFIALAFAGCDKLPFGSKGTSGKSMGEKPTMTDSTLAIVGTWSLSEDEFRQRLENLQKIAPDFDVTDPNSKSLVLEEIVRQQLLVEDAERSGIADKQEIKDAVEEFRRTLLVREVATSLSEGVEATMEEAQDYYDQNRDQFKTPTEWKLREIVVSSQRGAKDLLIEVLKGSDFQQAAKQKSISDSASRGGDLGYISVAPFPEMQTAIANLDRGDVSSVFKGPEGYYIVKVEDMRGGDQRSFSEIEQDIQAGLTLMKQQQAVLEHLTKIKDEVGVEINQELVEKIMGE